MARRTWAWVERVWLTIEEPRWVTSCQIAIYLLATAIGVATILSPPNTLIHVWGGPLATAWGLLMTVGGTLGALACYKGLWWLEARALGFIALGVFLRMILVGALHVTEPGSRLVQWLELSMILVALVTRWLRIRDLPIDPTRSRDRDSAHR